MLTHLGRRPRGLPGLENTTIRLGAPKNAKRKAIKQEGGSKKQRKLTASLLAAKPPGNRQPHVTEKPAAVNNQRTLMSDTSEVIDLLTPEPEALPTISVSPTSKTSLYAPAQNQFNLNSSANAKRRATPSNIFDELRATMAQTPDQYFLEAVTRAAEQFKQSEEKDKLNLRQSICHLEAQLGAKETDIARLQAELHKPDPRAAKERKTLQSRIAALETALASHQQTAKDEIDRLEDKNDVLLKEIEALENRIEELDALIAQHEHDAASSAAASAAELERVKDEAEALRRQLAEETQLHKKAELRAQHLGAKLAATQTKFDKELSAVSAKYNALKPELDAAWQRAHELEVGLGSEGKSKGASVEKKGAIGEEKKPKKKEESHRKEKRGKREEKERKEMKREAKGEKKRKKHRGR